MSEAVDPRFAPPQAHVADIASNEVTLAGRGVRFVAALVDLLIGYGAGWMLLRIPAVQSLAQAQTQDIVRDGFNWTPLSLAIGVAMFLVLQGWPLATRGQTIGKMLFKLRIVRTDGTNAEAWRLLVLRYGIGLLANIHPALSSLYWLINPLLIFRGSRKCLHDSIADTRVIKL